tara:strand:+ start:1271 stop:2848 length:1578 start_codon:yes stop_codon:yes gene_type:complete
MLRIILTFSASIIFSQSIENISYDFINHQGHILNKGSLVWNEDWHSNGLFFDGTFANYPSTYGPVIDRGFLKPVEEISSLDSLKTLSYFDYVQGDYYLDNLDLGIKYLSSDRVINLHAFKRRYAGAYNHYNYGIGTISPIHYTFLGDYNFRRNNENLFISVGNFNSDYGLLDSSNASFLDSRITSSSLKYDNQLDSLLFNLDYNIFFQRLNGFHSSSIFEGVIYLTRTKINGSMMMLSSNKYNYGLSYNLNKRSLGLDAVKNFNWNIFYLFIQNKKSKYSLGLNSFKDGRDLIFSGRSNFQLGLISSKINYERSHKPYHIAYSDSLNFEQNDCIWIENSLQMKRFNIGFDFAFKNFERDIDHMGLPTKGNNLWISLYLSPVFQNDLELSIRFNRSITNEYINDGIGDRMRILVGNNFNLFSNAMSVHYLFSVDGYMKRTTEYALTPVERYPLKQVDSIPLQDLWVPSFTVKSFIKNVEITYEMNHVKNIINDYFGKENSEQIIFNKFYPSVVRLASLSITWNFLN